MSEAREVTVLRWIHEYIIEKGWSPSVRDISNGFGWGSVSSAHRYLVKLEQKGFLDRGLGPRQVKVTPAGRQQLALHELVYQQRGGDG
jgi:repressor LexA